MGYVSPLPWMICHRGFLVAGGGMMCEQAGIPFPLNNLPCQCGPNWALLLGCVLSLLGNPSPLGPEYDRWSPSRSSWRIYIYGLFSSHKPFILPLRQNFMDNLELQPAVLFIFDYLTGGQSNQEILRWNICTFVLNALFSVYRWQKKIYSTQPKDMQFTINKDEEIFTFIEPKTCESL